VAADQQVMARRCGADPGPGIPIGGCPTRAIDAAVELEGTARIRRMLGSGIHALSSSQVAELVEHFNAIW
jgi:hypothetical protein